jgi:HK97 family phage major capsid protein
MENLQILNDALALARGEAEALVNKDDATVEEIKAKTAEIQQIKAKIEAQKALDEGNKEGEITDMTPVNEPIYAEPKDSRGPFKSFGEQMLAIVRSSKPGATIDNRLLEIQNATGASEGVPSEGGYLVQQDFSSEIIKTIYDSDSLAPLCRKVPISANSNSIKINGIDETSRADGYRWGGVQGYWANEAGTVTASKPKFRQIELTLNKVMALYYATDELLQDAAAMNSVLAEAFGDEIKFKVNDAIFRGDGSGKPLGILNAGCLVSQAAETGQAADTVIFENIVNMWSRMPASSRANSIWLINQEIEPQLFTMSIPVGTAGVPAYMPANGLSTSPYATLMGRPVRAIEYAAKLGDVGDIVFADFSKYLLADKGSVNFASSMHVLFAYDEMTFRVTYRVDGQPVLASALTPYKATSARTLSPFVALAAR